MNIPSPAADYELVILAPSEENRTNLVFRNYVRCFLDAGIYFPFSDDYQLPAQLPANLDPVRCLVIDPARKAEFEQPQLAQRLLEFQRGGGYVHFLHLDYRVGGSLGDAEVRHSAQRIINVAGLTVNHPRMIQRLQNMDETPLLKAWLEAAPDELDQYTRMKSPFSDPPAYITFRAACEAADYFKRPELVQPVWDHIARNIHSDTNRIYVEGGRYVLQWSRQTHHPEGEQLILRWASQLRFWRHNGVMINCDLQAPPGADPLNPPPKVLQNAWTWPETASHLGDLMGYLSKVTGDPRWAQVALDHILQAHQWLFDPQISLYRHVGRPGGPDRRSAPWGRGNAWFLYALRGMLDDLPAAHPNRTDLSRMLALELEGLLRWQNPQGLWHNVLDAAEGESRPCSSATSRYIHVYARAYSQGWLRDPRIPEMVRKAWAGLKTKIWERALIAYCVGTSHGLSRQVYLSRPHDTFRCSRSSLLLAWIEMQRMQACLK